MPPSTPRVRCGPTLPPVASPRLQCGPLKSPPAGGHHRAPKSAKRYSGPLRGAVMRRRAGQCWGLCSARCASHRPQQGRRCPSGRHARPPPGQAVQNAGCSVPPSPPLLSEWGQVGRCSLHERCGSGKATGPRGKKSCGPPAKGNEGERPPTGRGVPHRRTSGKSKCTAYGGSCLMISGVAGTETRACGPCGRTPTAHHPPKERKPP